MLPNCPPVNAAILSLVLACPVSVRAEDAPKELVPLLTQKPQLEPFGTFLGIRPYSPTFGLALWESRPGNISEMTFAGGHKLEKKKGTAPRDKSSARENNLIEAKKFLDLSEERLQVQVDERSEEYFSAIAERLAQENLLWMRNYDELGLNRQLRFKDEEGSALLLRFRDKFQMLNEETGGATFSYSDDRKASQSGHSFTGALMLDLYLDDLYNLDIASPHRRKHPWWIENPYRFWIRVGFEKQEDRINEDNESDFFRQYALFTFQANPDQNARLLSIPGLEITSPQILQIGAVHESNRITDEDSFRWIVGWEPRLVVTEGWFGSDVGRGFALNNRMYYREGGRFGELATSRKPSDGKLRTDAKEIVKQRSHIFSFINPKVDVEGAADSRVTFPDFSSVKDVESLKELQDEVITYQLSLGLGYDFRNKLPGSNTTALATASYTLRGVQPISSIGDGHLWHELRAEFNLFQSYPQAGGEEAGKNDWAGLTAYASWISGEAPPSYVDADLLTAGVTLRF